MLKGTTEGKHVVESRSATASSMAQNPQPQPAATHYLVLTAEAMDKAEKEVATLQQAQELTSDATAAGELGDSTPGVTAGANGDGEKTAIVPSGSGEPAGSQNQGDQWEVAKSNVYKRLGQWVPSAKVPLACIRAFREAQMRKNKVELWCICRQPYDEKRFYIQCGFCKEWFHGDCVGISSIESERYAKWCCTNCYELGQGESVLKAARGTTTARQHAKEAKDRKAVPENHTVDRYCEAYDPANDTKSKICALCLKPGLDWCSREDAVAAASAGVCVPVEGRFLGPNPFLMPKKGKSRTKEDEMYDSWTDAPDDPNKQSPGRASFHVPVQVDVFVDEH